MLLHSIVVLSEYSSFPLSCGCTAMELEIGPRCFFPVLLHSFLMLTAFPTFLIYPPQLSWHPISTKIQTARGPPRPREESLPSSGVEGREGSPSHMPWEGRPLIAPYLESIATLPCHDQLGSLTGNPSEVLQLNPLNCCWCQWSPVWDQGPLLNYKRHQRVTQYKVGVYPLIDHSRTFSPLSNRLLIYFCGHTLYLSFNNCVSVFFFTLTFTYMPLNRPWPNDLVLVP